MLNPIFIQLVEITLHLVDKNLIYNRFYDLKNTETKMEIIK